MSSVAKSNTATSPMPAYAIRNLKGTLPMKRMIMLIMKIIRAVERFSDMMRRHTRAIGATSLMVTSLKLSRSC